MTTKPKWEREYDKGKREFVRWLTGYGIRLVYVEDLGMAKDDQGWEHFAWNLTVGNRYHDATYTFAYRQGLAHTNRPALADIMAALLSDAVCVLDRSFEDFCDELGYDRDSRKAESTFNEIKANNDKLAKLFRSTDLDGIYTKAEPILEAAGLR